MDKKEKKKRKKRFKKKEEKNGTLKTCVPTIVISRNIVIITVKFRPVSHLCPNPHLHPATPVFIYFLFFILFLFSYVCRLSGDYPAVNTYVCNDGIKQLAEFVQRIFLARPSVTLSVMLNFANASPETRRT